VFDLTPNQAIRTAEAAIARVRTLHVPVEIGSVIICDACSPKHGDGPRRYYLEPYPCPTIRALDGPAVTEEQAGKADADE
jgi:hypothetical protein